jgi:hypothetical protein
VGQAADRLGDRLGGGSLMADLLDGISRRVDGLAALGRRRRRL